MLSNRTNSKQQDQRDTENGPEMVLTTVGFILKAGGHIQEENVGCWMPMDVSMSFDVFFGVEKVYTMFWIRVGVFVAIWGVLGDVYQNWG